MKSQWKDRANDVLKQCAAPVSNFPPQLWNVALRVHELSFHFLHFISLSSFLLKINDPFHSYFIINLFSLFVVSVEGEGLVITPSDSST
jgi:hypothetical protein